MLWDRADFEPIKLTPRNRGAALALISCPSQIDRIQGGMSWAGFDLSVAESSEALYAALPHAKPDIVLFDDRLVEDVFAFSRALDSRRVTQTLPVLPISKENRDDGGDLALTYESREAEVFLKSRAILRRDRPNALTGERKLGQFTLDEQKFKLFVGDNSTDLSKAEFCLLGPFFDLKNAAVDRQSFELLVFFGNDWKPGSRSADFYLSRMRRRIKTSIGFDPLRSIRGFGYALALEDGAGCCQSKLT